MRGQRFSIDTNILVYSIDKDAGTRHQQARELVDALVETDCVLTLQALAEFFHAVTRKDKMPTDEAAAMLHDWMELFPVAVADGRTLREADLRLRGLPTSAVLYGGNQIAADGGIDVRVELAADTDISGFIPRPAPGFQAKADDMPASEIEKEMRLKTMQTDGAKARYLRPSIRALAEVGGGPT